MALSAQSQTFHGSGSRDLYPDNTGGRFYMYSSTGRAANTIVAFPFPMLGEHFVYANVGEVIAIGSSAMGYVNGGVRVTSPTGSVTNYTGNSIGRIVGRVNELAGPRLPGGGGSTYVPYEITVGAGQAGVWKVEFLPVAPSNTTVAPYSPPTTNSGTWTQHTTVTNTSANDNTLIAAWDVSVRSNASGSWAWVPGRTYTNLLHLFLRPDANYSETYGFNGKVFVLTKDGYVYKVSNNGNHGVGFVFFANNNGFINKATNEPLYTSVNTSTDVIDFTHSPIIADADGNITNKMFYSFPGDLPATSAISGYGGTAWLRVPRIPPEVFEVKIIGYDGTEGQVSNKGGHFYFETDNLASRYTIVILPPESQPNLFATRILTGPAQEGENWIPWDGKDGDGNDLPPGLYSPRVGISLQTAETHFPYIDMEINPKGIIIELMKDDGTGVEPGMDKVYWNDTGVDNTTTGPNRPSPVNASPTAIPGGISSNSNGHRWGAYVATSGTTNAGNGDNGFGNEKSIDTWTFVEGESQNFTPEIFVAQSDVETISIASSHSGVVNVGDSWNYTVQVRNNGSMEIKTNTDPLQGLITGPASFMLYVPDGITLNPGSVIFNSPCGVAVVGTPTFANGVYTAQLDMPVACVATFTIPVTAVSGIQTGNGYVNVWATMLRPDDFTDIDATNPFPDKKPEDPFFEADGIQTAVDGLGGLGDDLFLLPSSINTSQTNNIKLNNQPYMLADLVVVKTVNPASGHNPQNPVVFTIVATNNGPSNATNVHVQDLFTDRYTYVSHTVSTGSYNHTTGDWNINTLANGASATMTITATINHSANPQINIATVTADEFDPDDSNNEDDAVTDAEFNADLEIVKVGTRTAEDGGNATFTLTVRNNGPGVASGVVVTDNLTNRYNFVSPESNHTASHGTLAWGGAENRNLTWTIGTLAVNEVATLTFITTNNNNGGTRTNTTTVTATGPDPNPDNNTYTLDFPTNTGAPVDLGVTKTVDKPTPAVGEEVTFTITLTHVAGANPVNQVVVTDVLPLGFAYGGHTVSQGLYNHITGEWTVGTVGISTAHTLVLRGYVKPPTGAANEYRNTASITGASRSDSNLSNNTASASVSPQIVDLSITKTIDDTTPDEGQEIEFVLTVTNHGPANAAGVTVYDKLPDGYEFVSDDGGGSYDEGTGVWTIGNLNSGSSATLTITANVRGAGQYVNTASVSGTLQETSYTNNSARLVVHPTCEIRNVSPKLTIIP